MNPYESSRTSLAQQNSMAHHALVIAIHCNGLVLCVSGHIDEHFGVPVALRVSLWHAIAHSVALSIANP